MHQDIKVYDVLLASGDEVSYQLAGDRHAWVQVIKGSVVVGGAALRPGDGATVSEETSLTISASEDAEICSSSWPEL